MYFFPLEIFKISHRRRAGIIWLCSAPRREDEGRTKGQATKRWLYKGRERSVLRPGGQGQRQPTPAGAKKIPVRYKVKLLETKDRAGLGWAASFPHLTVPCCLREPLAPKDEGGGSTPSQDKPLQPGLPFAIAPFIFNMFYDRVQFRRLHHRPPQLPLNSLINRVPKVPFLQVL